MALSSMPCWLSNTKALHRSIQKRSNIETITALSIFVVQASFIFASYRAVKACGFTQLKDFPLLQEDKPPS